MTVKVATYINLRSFLLLCGCYVLLTGCDPVFEPLQENNRYAYSINGMLDVTLDTQWVRVSVIRDSLRPPTAPVSPEVVVTLEHLETGNMVIMQNSIRTFRVINTDEPINVYNYWTTMNIDPEQSYRLSITGPEGQVSDVTTTIPPNYPAPEFIGNDLYFDVEEIDVIVDASIVFYYRHIKTDEIRRAVLPKLGLINLSLAPSYIRLRLGTEFARAHEYMIEHLDPLWPITKMGVYTAYGGPEWPPFHSLNELEQQIPGTASNINNGAGFVGGVMSHFIPICPLENVTFVPCPEGE